mmetsp:Transcript_14683/g.16795  ORF Transcript_14683/g.16795 Transcript_14683/m.16795 type:complete len:122 (+) Transcript_14683:852-1217(+)
MVGVSANGPRPDVAQVALGVRQDVEQAAVVPGVLFDGVAGIDLCLVVVEAQLPGVEAFHRVGIDESQLGDGTGQKGDAPTALAGSHVEDVVPVGELHGCFTLGAWVVVGFGVDLLPGVGIH